MAAKSLLVHHNLFNFKDYPKAFAFFATLYCIVKCKHGDTLIKCSDRFTWKCKVHSNQYIQTQKMHRRIDVQTHMQNKALAFK